MRTQISKYILTTTKDGIKSDCPMILEKHKVKGNAHNGTDTHMFNLSTHSGGTDTTTTENLDSICCSFLRTSR